MKIKVVTGFIGDCPFKELFESSIISYCKRHGYEFVFDSTTTHPNGIWWRKIEIVRQHLKTCDWLLWIDTDCLIINQAKPIESLIGDFDVMATKEDVIESGVMLFRNTTWTFEFLEFWESQGNRVERREEWLNNNHIRLEEIIALPEIASHFNQAMDIDFSIKNVNYKSRTPNTLVCHFPGSTFEDKLKEMQEIAPQFRFEDCYTSYVNLDHRQDRNERMVKELARVGVKAERTKGLLPRDVNQPDHKVHVMRMRTPGAIGCHYSQVAIMEKALEQGKHAWVMEDDLVFCNDLQKRLAHIEDFLNCHEWDVFWLGGTYHKDAEWHKSINGKHTHPDLQMCECTYNADWLPTEDARIIRTLGAWGTYCYIVNHKSIAKILELLDMNVYRSMGIDWLFILLQPQLKTFSFVPGCVKQYDNLSDIGLNGGRQAITQFSGFANLGGYWFQERMEDYK